MSDDFCDRQRRKLLMILTSQQGPVQIKEADVLSRFDGHAAVADQDQAAVIQSDLARKIRCTQRIQGISGNAGIEKS